MYKDFKQGCKDSSVYKKPCPHASQCSPSKDNA